MSNHAARSLLQYKNDISVAQWRYRFAVMGGHDLPDLRTWRQLELARVIQFAAWRLRRPINTVRQIACGEFLPMLLRRQAS